MPTPGLYTRITLLAVIIRLFILEALILVTRPRVELILVSAASSLHPLTAILVLALLVLPSSPVMGIAGISLVYASWYIAARSYKPGLLAALAAASGAIVGYYTLLVYNAVLSPPGAPLLLREALVKIYSSYTLRYLLALASMMPTVYLYTRLARAASDAFASPRAARLLIMEWVRAEAERVKRLQAWYHKALAYALGALIAFPITILTGALIAVIYAGLELIAPPGTKNVMEALGVARGVISTILFVVLEYLMAGWAKSLLAYKRVERPSRFSLYSTLALLAIAIVVASLITPSAFLDGLNPFTPPPRPTGFDYEAYRVLNQLAMRIEMSEKALQALVEFLWGRG